MAISKNEEARLLAQDERDFVAKTRAGALKGLSDRELSDVISLVRERRKRARDIASRQRREMRGKAQPAGTKPAPRNDGTTRKAEVLSSALKRLNNERARRAAAAAVPTQVQLARKALRKKRASEALLPKAPKYRTASKGMRNIENEKTRDLTHPMEVGRVNKFVAVAQAKRDARG